MNQFVHCTGGYITCLLLMSNGWKVHSRLSASIKQTGKSLSPGQLKRRKKILRNVGLVGGLGGPLLFVNATKDCMDMIGYFDQDWVIKSYATDTSIWPWSSLSNILIVIVLCIGIIFGPRSGPNNTKQGRSSIAGPSSARTSPRISVAKKERLERRRTILAKREERRASNAGSRDPSAATSRSRDADPLGAGAGRVSKPERPAVAVNSTTVAPVVT